MSLYIVDIHGELEGDYEIIRKYEEPRTGHWIEVTYGKCGYECDICHEPVPCFSHGTKNFSHFCPNCGAKMVRPWESEG